MAIEYFDNLSAWERANLTQLFSAIEDALSGGAYPDGLGEVIAEYAALAPEERAAAYMGITDPAQAALDEVLPILTDEQAEGVIDAFPAWAAGVAYAQGVRVRYGGKLYRCVQAHTSQADWTPDATPALWTRIGEPGEVPVWVQPTGAQDAYNTGDKVHYPTAADPVYESTIDGNVWSPADYPAGWTEVA